MVVSSLASSPCRQAIPSFHIARLEWPGDEGVHVGGVNTILQVKGIGSVHVHVGGCAFYLSFCLSGQQIEGYGFLGLRLQCM